MTVKTNNPIKALAYGNNISSSFEDDIYQHGEFDEDEEFGKETLSLFPNVATLDNPFSKNKFGSVDNTLKVTTFGNSKPVVFESTKPGTSLPITPIKNVKSEAHKNYDSRKRLDQNIKPIVETKGWWKKRTRTQKTIMVTSGIVLLGITLYVISQKITKK